MATLKYISCADLEDLAQEVVQSGGCFEIQATGHSMQPEIRDGDPVVLGPLRPGLPRLGEVILARVVEGLVLHRVVGIHRLGGQVYLALLGDAEAGAGRLVPTHAAVARVVRGPRRSWWPRLVDRLRIVFRATR